MLSEKDFRDITFCKRLIKRAFREKNLRLLKSLLNKVSALFIFSAEEFRKEIIEFVYSEMNSWTFEEILDVCKESVLGNVVTVCYFMRKVGVITLEKLEVFVALSKLDYIEDPLTFNFIPTKEVLILDLNERVKSLIKAPTIEKAIEVCELFFINGRLEKSKDTISGMLLLYENSKRPEQRFKGSIISALLSKRLDMFLSLIKRVYKDIEDKKGVVKYYIEIFDLLVRVGVPVFFDFNNYHVEFDKFYNGNFYFARLLDKSGNERLIFPFEQIDVVQVQQIFDLETEAFVTPKGRIGKVMLNSVYSFRKIREITEVTNEQVEITKKMLEDEIEEKMRGILQDQNITSHGPAEKTDVYEHKLFVNNESDLRDVGIIIKGRGYPKITLHNVASNILKAVDLPVQIVFLFHTGILLDEAREKFTNQCDRAKKMHCVVDPVDLTKLLVAYRKLLNE